MHTVQSSNPTGLPGCHNTDCLACKAGPGNGGNCLKSNVQYELNYKLCPLEDRCTYIGETSRNLYTRAKEHTGKYNSEKQGHESFIKKHQEERHHGLPANFEGKVTSMFREFLSRQVSEGVCITCPELQKRVAQASPMEGTKRDCEGLVLCSVGCIRCEISLVFMA